MSVYENELLHGEDLNNELCHYGVKGQKWGERNYQNKDGSLTALGRIHYGIGERKAAMAQNRASKKKRKSEENAKKLAKERADFERRRELRAIQDEYNINSKILAGRYRNAHGYMVSKASTKRSIKLAAGSFAAGAGISLALKASGHSAAASVVSQSASAFVGGMGLTTAIYAGNTALSRLFTNKVEISDYKEEVRLLHDYYMESLNEAANKKR